MYTPLIVLFRENTPAPYLGTAIGWLVASTSIGYAASIALTGLSVGISGWRLAFLTTGLPPMVGAVILLVAIKAVPNVVLQKVQETVSGRSFGAMTAQGNCLAGIRRTIGSFLACGLGHQHY